MEEGGRPELAAGRIARAPQGGLWAGLIQRRLRQRVGRPLHIRVTDNVHTMLSFGRREGALEVRLHHMFLTAPEAVIRALGEYIRGGDPGASAVLDSYILHHRFLIRHVPPHVRRRRVRIHTGGEAHDLHTIFQRVNGDYFDGGVDCAITWTAPPLVKLPRQSIKLGSYSIDARLIRVHPALDQPMVPHFFVSWIVFHEMLHHIHRATSKNGKRCVHTPAFAAEERAHPDHDRARAWERDHLDMLLWWRPGGRVHGGQLRSAAYTLH